MRQIWFQQDGAPAHCIMEAREWLMETFDERCIGRLMTRPWPARSPDLNPLDFFFWSFLKEKIYQTPVVDIIDLEFRIDAAFLQVTPGMLERCQESVVRRCQCCIEVGGGTFEALL